MDQQQHSERVHALLGGSSANRWVNCTGSYFLSKDLVPKKSGKAADKGTFIHEVAEEYLKAFLKHKIDGSGYSIRAGLDLEVVQQVLKYSELIWEKVLEQLITGKGYGFEDQFVIDKKLGLWGYADFWAVYIDDKGLRTGVVVDLKTGYHEVDIEKNAQLAFYAVAMREFVRSKGKDLDQVRTVIIQPPSEIPYKESKKPLSTKQLDDWRKKFFGAAHEIFVKQKPTFKLGNWCDWCPAQAKCPKYVKDLSVRSSLAIIDPDKIQLPDIKTIPDETLAKLSLLTPQLTQWLNEVNKYGISRALQLNPLPGTKAVQTNGKRKWKDNTEEIAEALRQLGVEDPLQKPNPKLKTITEIERELDKETLIPFVEKSKGSILLVAADDPRQSVRNAFDMIDAIVEPMEE